MRPGQNKRLRGRSGRKGPNPLTRSFESNGPDVKIRGTAQHVAEKYLQLARDAQSSGDIVLAENLLQHAEHYFRLISAAQQAQAVNTFGRQNFEAEFEEDDDDDFSGVPDRFAPLSERLPPPVYQQPQQQPFVAAPAQQPMFAPPQPQPQPFEERPAYPDQPRGDSMQRHERQGRPQRQPFRERSAERPIADRGDQGGEGGEGGGRQFGFNRNRDRDRPRFQPRREAMGEPAPASEHMSPAGLPAFITAPAPRPAGAPAAPVEGAEAIMADDRESSVFHNRRRRKMRGQLGEGGGDNAPVASELPLGE